MHSNKIEKDVYFEYNTRVFIARQKSYLFLFILLIYFDISDLYSLYLYYIIYIIIKSNIMAEETREAQKERKKIRKKTTTCWRV